MHYYPSTGYMYCRSGSDSKLSHRRSSRRDPDPADSGDSTLSDVDETESGSGIEVNPNIPYPGIAPLALGYLTQTTRPRSWCLALISNPYPLHANYYLSLPTATVRNALTPKEERRKEVKVKLHLQGLRKLKAIDTSENLLKYVLLNKTNQMYEEKHTIKDCVENHCKERLIKMNIR